MKSNTRVEGSTGESSAAAAAPGGAVRCGWGVGGRAVGGLGGGVGGADGCNAARRGGILSNIVSVSKKSWVENKEPQRCHNASTDPPSRTNTLFTFPAFTEKRLHPVENWSIPILGLDSGYQRMAGAGFRHYFGRNCGRRQSYPRDRWFLAQGQPPPPNLTGRLGLTMYAAIRVPLVSLPKEIWSGLVFSLWFAISTFPRISNPKYRNQS